MKTLRYILLPLALAATAAGCTPDVTARVEANVAGVGTQSLRVVSRGVNSAQTAVTAVTAVDNQFAFSVPCAGEPVLVQVFTSQKMPLATFRAEPGDNVRLGSDGFVTGGTLTGQFAEALATLPSDPADPAADNLPIHDYLTSHKASPVAAALLAARFCVRADPAMADSLMALADTARHRLARLPLPPRALAPFQAMTWPDTDTLATISPGGVMIFTSHTAPPTPAMADSLRSWHEAGLTPVTHIWLGTDTASWHHAISSDSLPAAAPSLQRAIAPLPPLPAPLTTLPCALLSDSTGRILRQVLF